MANEALEPPILSHAHIQHTSGALKSRAFKLTFLCLCLCNFISTLDSVIIATSLPAIAHALDATSIEAYWCGSAFLFAQAVSQPLYGAFSETFGRKLCLIIALTTFTAFSLLCALAQNITWLIIARVFQGVGAGGLNALVMMIVADMVSLRERGKYISIMALVSAVASVGGIVMGSAIAERSSWRLIFYINIPVCVPAIVGIIRYMTLQGGTLSLREKLNHVDWMGMIIITGSLTSLLYGITSGGVLHSWTSAETLSALLIGFVGVAAFLLCEKFHAKMPMIPLRIFNNRTAASALLTSFVMGLVLWAMQYYLILYFLVSRRRSLVGASIDMLPGTAVAPPSAALGGFIVSKTKRFRIMNNVAWAFLTTGFALMTILSPESSKVFQFGPQVIYGIGGGILYMGRLCAMQASQPDEDVPMATALVSFTSSLGQAFGIGIGGAIFQNEWEHQLKRRIREGSLPSEFILSKFQAEQAVELLKSFPEAVQRVYASIVADAIDSLFVALAAFSGVALLGSMLSKNLSMDRDTHSKNEFVEREKITTNS